MKIISILIKCIIVYSLFMSPAYSQNISHSTDNSEGYPTFKNGSLYIQRVDTVNQVGNYGDVVFRFDSSTNAWELENYQETKDLGTVTDIELITIDSVMPVQIFLKLTEEITLNNPCYEIQLGKIDQRFIGDEFHLTVHAPELIPRDIICTQVITDESFTRIVPLRVYGLDAGVYKYSINEAQTGTFNLLFDNFVPIDK